MSRKPDPIDIVQLFSKGDNKVWNHLLTKAARNQDLAWLARTRNQVQRGMALAVKKKQSTPKLELFFIRLQNSLEKTMKQIIRAKHPNPCDNPLTAKENSEWLDVKRRRDQELERYLKSTAY